MIRKFEKNFKKYIIEVMRIITIRMVIVVVIAIRISMIIIIRIL